MSESLETSVVQGTWDLTAYQWKTNAFGMRLLTQGYKDRKVLGVKCHQCGTVYVPAAAYCRKCFVDIDQIHEVEDHGKVVTFTAVLADIHGNPMPEIKVTTQVKLEGSDCLMSGELKGIDWQKVHAGMAVKIVWAEETTGALADFQYFEPA
jgi:uncharacterized protein